MPRLGLPGVTLCAAASVNLAATVEALRASLAQCDFERCILFSDRRPELLDSRIDHRPIGKIRSTQDYSDFMLSRLADEIQTPHCLVVQWDGFVLNAANWANEFLEFDYIGAVWPQFPGSNNVGNGGFSLRSKRLLDSCGDPRFVRQHPEDIAICRTNRPFLEREFGIRFADGATAQRFSTERSGSLTQSFGFHGVFNVIPALGVDHFWSLYRSLDDLSTIGADYRRLMQQLGESADSSGQRVRLTLDMLSHRIVRLLPGLHN